MQNIHSVTWPVQNVLAFTTTRHHPVISGNKPVYSHCLNSEHDNLAESSPPFDSFNLGIHVGDNNVQVQKNREVLIEFLPEQSAIQWLDQVHGAKVVEINSISNEPVTADAVFTREKQIALAIMTADCLPLLLSTKTGEVIAAIHGGWRPLAQNIIKHTVNKMAVSVEYIYAWLGPCIGNKVFEVGADVRDHFLVHSKSFIPAFSRVTDKTPTKYYADLQLIAQLQLQQLGINNINLLSHCTYTMNKEYYSYRRDGTTGRMVSIICRK